MNPTDTSQPDYFHKVVDCQWACPAHTDVPEYIRLIALGKFSEAYLVNRESNVFPGILGRVCDRPCEPACRRGRVEEKPVAICRLKRVAADHKDDITERLPVIPKQKNGKRVVCIGAGPASLTVANDLLPLGYEVTVLEQWDRAGGLMRTNIPSFRLPEQVLDDEVIRILKFGVETGDPRSWTSFDQVWTAFCAQMEHLGHHVLRQQYVAMQLKPSYFAAPQTSMLNDLAMKECRDLHSHGDWFEGAIAGMRAEGVEPFGGIVESDWHRHTFLHPRDSGGVLFQLFEE